MRRFITQTDGRLAFEGTCMFCQKASSVSNLDPARVALWDDGRGPMIQDAFPLLTSGERETILSGCHESCFDAAFADDEE